MIRRDIVLVFCFLALTGAAGLVTGTSGQDQPAAEGDTDSNPLVASADELVAKLEQTFEHAAELRAEAGAATGDDLRVVEQRILRIRAESTTDVNTLCDNILQQEAEGLDASRYRKFIEPWMYRMAESGVELSDKLQNSLSSLRAEREDASPEDLEKIEARIDEVISQLDNLFEIFVAHVDKMEALGLEATAQRQYLVETTSDRAQNLVVRLNLVRDEIEKLQEKAAADPGNTEIQSELHAAEDKLVRITDSLGDMVGSMEELGLETTEYKKVLIEATGSITTDVLDTAVALSLVQQWAAGTRNWIVESGPTLLFKFIVFLLILFLFRLLAGVVRKVVRKAVSTSRLRLSTLLREMIVKVASGVVMILGILIALSQIGVSLGPLLAGLGIAGFIVGFALQDVLGNFAAGLMILIYRPFDVGDLIDASGVFGRVSHMSLVSTTILTLDHQTLIIPNNKIWGDVIKNVTAQRNRRVDMLFGVSYTDDIPQVENVLREILAEHDKVLDDPEPMVHLHTLGESSVDFVVRPWVRTDDYWDVYWDVTREVKMRFDREGISIPFPQRDVHLYPDSTNGGTETVRGDRPDER